MGALSAAYPTVFDIASRSNPDGKIATIAEVLHQMMPILDDIYFVEANNGASHISTLRKSIPTPTWRLFNQGVVSTKSGTKQISDTCGMLEAYSEVDKKLADLNSNMEAFRMSEDKAQIEGMNNSVASTLFYGDTDVYPERFIGLAPRYYLSTATTGENIIKAGGSGDDNTSIWLVTWGENATHGIYPKGLPAGLQYQNLGEVTAIDADNNGKYQAYRSHYSWDIGLTVRDWRANVRIANIDVSDLNTAGDATDNSANILKYMSIATDLVPDEHQNAKQVFYVNRTVMSMLKIKLMEKSNVNLTLEDITGPNGVQRKVLHFMGIPVRRVSNDILLNTESTVS
jgi:hypothetical protein